MFCGQGLTYQRVQPGVVCASVKRGTGVIDSAADLRWDSTSPSPRKSCCS